jgi:hypothetical protein
LLSLRIDDTDFSHAVIALTCAPFGNTIHALLLYDRYWGEIQSQDLPGFCLITA